MSERRFPIQGEFGRNPNIGVRRWIPASWVPWSEAEIAYATYAKLYGDQQSLERLAERSGFGREEYRTLRLGLDIGGRKVFDVPPWTEESEITDL